jgi:hypothetical protein
MVAAQLAALLSFLALAQAAPAPAPAAGCRWCPDTVELAVDAAALKLAQGKPGAIGASLTGGFDGLRLGLSWLSLGVIDDPHASTEWSDSTQRWALRVGLRNEVEPEFFVDLDADLGIRAWQGYVRQGDGTLLWSTTKLHPDGSVTMTLSTDFGSRFFRWGFGATVGWSPQDSNSMQVPATAFNPAYQVSGVDGGLYFGGFMRIAIGKVNRR